MLAAPMPSPGDFLNPTPGGASIGVPPEFPGSFGCLVVDRQGRTFAITAGHVVQSFQGPITAGLHVLQPPAPPPGMPPGANPQFGVTANGFLGNKPDAGGFVDFALIEIDAARAATSVPLDQGPVIPQVLPSALVINNRIPMTKFGAGTGRTFAAFSARVASIVIAGLRVTNVLEFKGVAGRPVAAGGDSGTLAVSDGPGSQGTIIGILFAAAGPSPDAPAGRAFVMPFERLVGIRPI